MKILILDEEIPFPTNNGKRTRTFNLYRRLASRFQIRYLTYADANPAGVEALRRAGIQVAVVPGSLPARRGPQFYAALLFNLLSPLPYIVARHRARGYEQSVRTNVAQFRPDLVICEWTPYAIYARSLSAVKSLITAHNIEADIWRRYFENEPNPVRRLYMQEQWRKVRRFERAALDWVDAVVAVSELDRGRIARARPALQTSVVPNGVDLEYFLPGPQPAERHHLVFTGSLDWRPNQDAARFFAREILPRVHAVRPDVQTAFVGRDPPADVVALGRQPGVSVPGAVEDVRPHVMKAAVFIVPLRVGGGSRLKILEAMAMGRAIVSTTVGAEGLDVEPGRHLLLADQPQAFAEAILRLLSDPALCAKLAVEGRRLVEQRYGWDAIAAQCGDFLQRVIGEREAAYGEAATEAME